MNLAKARLLGALYISLCVVTPAVGQEQGQNQVFDPEQLFELDQKPEEKQSPEQMQEPDQPPEQELKLEQIPEPMPAPVFKPEPDPLQEPDQPSEQELKLEQIPEPMPAPVFKPEPDPLQEPDQPPEQELKPEQIPEPVPEPVFKPEPDPLQEPDQPPEKEQPQEPMQLPEQMPAPERDQDRLFEEDQKLEKEQKLEQMPEPEQQPKSYSEPEPEPGQELDQEQRLEPEPESDQDQESVQEKAKVTFNIRGIRPGDTIERLREVFPDIPLTENINKAHCKYEDHTIDNGTSFDAVHSVDQQSYAFRLILVDGVQTVVKGTYTYISKTLDPDFFTEKILEKYDVDEITEENLPTIKHAMSDYKGITYFIQPKGHYFKILDDDVLRLIYKFTKDPNPLKTEITHTVVIEGKKYRALDETQAAQGEKEKQQKEAECAREEVNELAF